MCHLKLLEFVFRKLGKDDYLEMITVGAIDRPIRVPSDHRNVSTTLFPSMTNPVRIACTYYLVGQL